MNILAAISVGTPRGANVPKIAWGDSSVKWFAGRGRDISVHSLENGFGAHPASYAVGMGCFFSRRNVAVA